MAIFRLSDSYALRKFTNKIPMIVKFGNLQGKWKISEDEMNLLKKCDGVIDIAEEDLSEEERIFLREMIDKRVVKEISEPLPLISNRAYKEYNHKRIASANWGITVRCNMNCLHCLNLEGQLTKEEPDISIDEARIIIDKLAEYGVEGVDLFGGEPTVYPQFMELVRMIYESGLVINSINTNAMLINAGMLDELAEIGADPIFAISFDGLGMHDWMRNRKGCEEPVKKAIKLCVDKGFKTNICININKRTLPVLEDTVQYFMEMGCKRFKLLRTSESFRWRETEKNLGENLTISTMDFASIMLEFIRKHIKDIRGGVRFTIFNTITIGPNSTGKSVISEIAGLPEKTSGWCPAAENGMFVGYKGNITPCPGVDQLVRMHGLYSDSNNILKSNLEDIIYSDFYIDHFRITKKDVFDKSKECQECSKWNICNGGICRMNAAMLPHSLAIGAPPIKEIFSERDAVYCSLIKGGYIEAIADILDNN